MTFDSLVKDLKNRKFKPLYLFSGEEPYYTDKLVNLIEETVLGEAERSFDQTIVYGRDLDVSKLAGIAKRFPMMAPMQVVIVKEAQELKGLENLISYIENPSPATMLVLAYKYKKADKRTKFYKTFTEKGIVFESEKIKDYAIPDWINAFVAENGYKINPKATMLLAENLGNDLNKIENEMSKLFLNVKKEDEILPKHIEDNIGISKDFNVFELQNALAKKDVLKAYQIADYFASNPRSSPFVLTIASLYSFFSKILIVHSTQDKSNAGLAKALGVGPYFTTQYAEAAKIYTAGKTMHVISCLREYDVRFKGVDNVSTGEGALLKELIFKILH